MRCDKLRWSPDSQDVHSREFCYNKQGFKRHFGKNIRHFLNGAIGAIVRQGYFFALKLMVIGFVKSKT